MKPFLVTHVLLKSVCSNIFNIIDTIMNKKLTNLTFFLALLLVNNAFPYIIHGPESDKTIIFEINDKYNEVTLALTSNSIYIEFDKSVKDYVNQELIEEHNLQANQFIDSEGFFVPGSMILLKENKLEYLFSELETVLFHQGKLTFKYIDKKEFVFEDILNTDGNQALKNFYLEDLEEFFHTYKGLVS